MIIRFIEDLGWIGGKFYFPITDCNMLPSVGDEIDLSFADENNEKITGFYKVKKIRYLLKVPYSTGEDRAKKKLPKTRFEDAEVIIRRIKP